MKKLLRYLPLLIFAVILSCTTTEEGLDKAAVLKVSANNMDIGALGGNDSFTITSQCDWSTEVSYKGADTKWIKLSSTEGESGTKDVTVTFDENKSVDDRYATITVSNSRYNLSQSIEIHQKAGEPFILLDQSEKEVAADGEVLEIIVNSNIDYTITSSESWAQTSIDSGSKGESKIAINIDNSPVIEPRSATITFLGKEHNTTATFSIMQQKLVPTIELDTEVVSSLAMGATSSVSVDSNISWEASCAADWVTITPTNGEKGLSNIMVKVDENAKTTVRETVVKVFNSEYNVEKQIAISQEAFGPVLDVDHESISAPVAGTTQSITVDGNISWEASCAADWVTITPRNGEKGPSTLKVEVAENTKTSAREAVIKISNSEYKVEKQITVSQEAFGPVLNVSTESISAPVAGTTKSITVDGNISWNASCTADWVTITPTNGEKGSSTLNVEIAANTKASVREAAIKVFNAEYNIEKQITISQEAFGPVLSVSAESISVPVSGTTKSITVDGNISWKASCAADWVTITPTNGGKGTSTLKVLVSQNTKASVREAAIKVFNAEYNIEKQITISQEAFGPVLSVSAESISAPVSGTTKSITVDGNISWVASCTADWVTITPNSGEKGASTIKIEVSANARTVVREAVIKVSNSEYKVEKQIAISQEALSPILSVSTESISAPVAGTIKNITIDGNIPWNASCTADWVTITPAYGNKGTSTLNVEIVANNKTSVRETVVKVFNTEYNVEKQITISQEAFDPVLSAGTESISAPVAGTAKNITVEGNISWNASCAAEWVTITPTYGNKGASTLNVEITANTKASVRETVVKVFNTEYNIEKQVAISQEAMPAIVYTSSNGKVVEPNNTDAFGASIVSNTYQNGQGMIVFNAPITTIGKNAFARCESLTSVTIPNSVTTIDEDAFFDCSSLKSITVPNSVTTIGRYAFLDCSSLTSITIPESVTSIGRYAFRGCSSLTAFYGKFASTDNRCLIVNGTLNSFAPAGLTKYTIPNGVVSIGDGAFYDCGSLISITIPNSVTSIGVDAFYGCSSLISITIPNSVVSIGEYAFAVCSSLTSITIPDSVASIDMGAFVGCCGLASVTVGNSVTKIGVDAFSDCSSLTSVIIGNSVTDIGVNAFYGCSSLISITIPENVTRIGGGVFSGCSSLTSLYCKPATPPSNYGPVDLGVYIKIYVPMESVAAYKSSSNWSRYVSYIVGYDFSAEN